MEGTDIHQRIDGMIQAERVVLFMKGNKLFPQCGLCASCSAEPRPRRHARVG